MVIKPTSKLHAKMHKEISKVVNDALRAQKTQHVIYEETKEKEDDDSQDADMVSIQMENLAKK